MAPRPDIIGVLRMNGEFDVNDYWLKRGRANPEEETRYSEFHRLQERFLADILRKSQLPMHDILELGCGSGRITKLLAEFYPAARITALDLSPDRLDAARRYCVHVNNVRFEQYDF